MITTGEILARNARKYPGREALVFEDRRYTYEELNVTVNRLANALRQTWGWIRVRKSVLLSLNSDSFILSYFAVMKRGGRGPPELPPGPAGGEVHAGQLRRPVLHCRRRNSSPWSARSATASP